jgi:hypothetical protein
LSKKLSLSHFQHIAEQMTEDENDKEEIKLLMTILREKGFHEAVRR